MDIKTKISELQSQVKDNIVYVSCEKLSSKSFEAYTKDDGTEGLKVKGFALPFDKPSRNRVGYTKQSIIDKHKTFVGQPFLFNHDDKEIRGHILDTYVDENGMWYEADLDTGEVDFIRKLKRGDIPYVSVQLMFGDCVEQKDPEGNWYMLVDMTEGLEISSVAIPGFADTTIKLAESLRTKKGDEAMSENKTAPDQVNLKELFETAQKNTDEKLNLLIEMVKELKEKKEEEDETGETGKEEDETGETGSEADDTDGETGEEGDDEDDKEDEGKKKKHSLDIKKMIKTEATAPVTKPVPTNKFKDEGVIEKKEKLSLKDELMKIL